jgi:hypothetical protein
VWARVLVTSTLVNPRIAVAADMGGTSVVEPRYTVEYGPTGKLLVCPSSGTVYRLARLGTVTFDATSGIPKLTVTGTVDAASSGVFGLDYLMLALSRRRAASISGVPAAQTSSFVPSTSTSGRKRSRATCPRSCRTRRT